MLKRINQLAKGESGQGVIGLIVTIAAVVIAGTLVAITMATAVSIDKKAATIEESGIGINEATTSILQLRKTNATADSILETAKPLVGQIDQIIGLAKSIDGLAISINGTAGTILNTAKNINGEAADILDTAKAIRGSVTTINGGLDQALGLARAIQGDTGKIVVIADIVHTNACAIDRAVSGSNGGDPQC
jgi:hypothetical protein